MYGDLATYFQFINKEGNQPLLASNLGEWSVLATTFGHPTYLSTIFRLLHRYYPKPDLHCDHGINMFTEYWSHNSPTQTGDNGGWPCKIYYGVGTSYFRQGQARVTAGMVKGLFAIQYAAVFLYHSVTYNWRNVYSFKWVCVANGWERTGIASYHTFGIRERFVYNIIFNKAATYLLIDKPDLFSAHTSANQKTALPAVDYLGQLSTVHLIKEGVDHSPTQLKDWLWCPNAEFENRANGPWPAPYIMRGRGGFELSNIIEQLETVDEPPAVYVVGSSGIAQKYYIIPL